MLISILLLLVSNCELPISILLLLISKREIPRNRDIVSESLCDVRAEFLAIYLCRWILLIGFLERQ